MKKYSLLFLLIVSLSLFAQDELGYWSNIRHSGVTESGDIYLRCETNPAEQTQFLYRNDEDIWHTEWMEVLEGPTHQVTFPYSSENVNYGRFKTNTEDFVMMMPAYVPNNEIPASVHSLGYIASDAEGDSQSVLELDITDTYLGYSDEKMIVGLQNVNGSYPTDSGGVFPSEYYLYISGFINVETAIQDTVMYGIVYADVPFVFSSGLYKIVGEEFSLDSIEKIGDISHDIIDDVLVMSCEWIDLVEDEHFGDWPSQSNTLAFQFMTQVVNLNMEITSADDGIPSMQTFQQYAIEPFENSLPEINEVDYSIDIASSTVSFSYYDQNNNFPLTAELIIDSSIYQMYPNGFDYSEAVIYSTTFPETEWESGFIRVSDNNIDYVEEDVIVTSAESSVISHSLQANVYPNPFNPKAEISFSINKNQFVSVDVFDCKGRKRENLFQDFAEKGKHTINWNAENYASGVYLLKIQTEKKLQVLKALLLK